MEQSKRPRIKTLLFSGAAATGLLLGGAGLASATVNQGSASVQPRTSAGQVSEDVQEPSLQGSITAPEQDGVSEADEVTALQSLATITPEQARDSALAAVPGTVGKVELDNENGSVVYSVEIDGSDVKVDAGTGEVLNVEAADANEANDSSEADEAEDAEDAEDANEAHEANEAGGQPGQ